MTGQDLGVPVVITDSDHPSVDPEHSVLDEAGIGLRREQCLTESEVIARCTGAQVLINQYAPITADVLDALPEVRLVVRYGVGVETVDVDAATHRGVWVANVPDYGAAEVADHTMALALALLRGVTGYDRSVRSGDWDYQVGAPLHRLTTRTFGIVGCGMIGQTVAARAAAFGMRVIGVETAPGRSLEGTAISRVDLDELLATSDIVSLHATLLRGSSPLIDAHVLSMMKPSAMLVNTARGGLIDTAALVAALDAGRIAGAALDVLETEPVDPAMREALARHPRVVLSPHAAWYSEESFVQLKSEVAREAVRVLTGQQPRCPVNRPSVGASAAEPRR